MGTIAQELARLQTAKADIKTAIEGKGITVPSATTIDGYPALIDQISTGIQEAEENDVNFYDYDGFRVASFTIAEAKALTQAEYNAILPPTHEGLTFQEWNWTLADIQSYNRRYVDIGANYSTNDGKSHFKADICNNDVFLTFIALAQTIYVDWGDGSEVDSYNFPSSSTEYDFTHTYTNTGFYDIKFWCGGTGRCGFSMYGVNRNIRIRELNLNRASLNQNYALYQTNLLLSISNSCEVNPIRGFINSSIPIVSMPRDNSENVVIAGYFPFEYINGKVCFPKTIKSIRSQQFITYSSDTRIVLPEYTTSENVNSDCFSNSRYATVISIPLSLKFSTLSFTGCVSLVELDIANGWIPSANMTLSSSTQWTTQSIVDFFTKLGDRSEESTTLTLTFGSTNLNKLTADQKAIATNKGYTLA